jgi:hypothetical protein
MSIKFFVTLAALCAALILNLGCVTASFDELAHSANPQAILIKAPRACAGPLIKEPEIRAFCFELAKLEAHRAEIASQALGYAAGEVAKAQAMNPCAGRTWFMAPSICYGGPNRTWDGGAAYMAGRYSYY